LRDNPISHIVDPASDSESPVFPSSLSYVDLSYNSIRSWSFICHLQDVFPGLRGLRVSHNPLYDSGGSENGPVGIDEGYMLTLARLSQLENLNFSRIAPQERRDAEMYYLSRIAKAAAAVPEDKEAELLADHPRYSELCKSE
jgi:hypothetical protein